MQPRSTNAPIFFSGRAIHVGGKGGAKACRRVGSCILAHARRCAPQRTAPGHCLAARAGCRRPAVHRSRHAEEPLGRHFQRTRRRCKMPTTAREPAATRPPSARIAQPTQDRGNALSASFYTLTHDTDSYRPAAILPHAAGRPLTRPGGRPQPLAAAFAPLTATTQARRHPRRAAPIAADAPPLRCVRLSTGARRCLERSMSLARAATRSRRSDHP